MHGRKKSDLPQTKEEKDAVQSKISNYKKASGPTAALHQHIEVLEQLLFLSVFQNSALRTSTLHDYTSTLLGE